MRTSAITVSLVRALAVACAGCASPPTQEGGRVDYSIHVAATPEQVWEMLTDTASSSACWAHEWRFESSWEVGSPVAYIAGDGTPYSEGRVLAATPGRLLAYTWPAPDGTAAASAPEVVRWEIAPSGPQAVKVTVVHEGLSEAGLARGTKGWEYILSNMKSLLEVGEPIAYFPKP